MDKVYHGRWDQIFWVYSPGLKLQSKCDTHLPVSTYCNNHVKLDPNTFKCLGHTETEDFIPAQEEWKKNGWTEDWAGLKGLDSIPSEVFNDAWRTKKIVSPRPDQENNVEEFRKEQKMAIKNYTNTTPQFGEMDTNNSRTFPIGKYDDFVGSWTPQGPSPTLQIGVIGSHPMTICIHQSFNRTDIGVVDKYEYTTPNVPIIIQRTLAFGYYAVSAYKYYDKNMEHLHLITKTTNHPAIAQGIIQ